jgi:hypothetical protein
VAVHIERPVFYEGQILSAADLDLAVEYSRVRDARDVRYRQTWGIVTGLELRKVPKRDPTNNADYVDAFVDPGSAVAGTGRELLVAEAERLSEDLFDQLSVFSGQTDEWHPVFVIGRDEPQRPSTSLTGRCAIGQSSRVIEGYEIRFGRPGDENTVFDPPALTDDESDAGPWPILLGFVKWNPSLGARGRFIDARDRNDDGVGPRYAGVQADEVSARGGVLTLRSGPVGQAGAPALVLDETSKDAMLRVGLQDAKGAFQPLLALDKSGNLTLAGAIKPTVPSEVKVTSGVVFDGMEVPLPAGVTAQNVADGSVIVHVQVTPVLDPPASIGANFVPLAVECGVDAQRRVRCRIAWFQPGATPGTVFHLASANYFLATSTVG